MIIGISPGEYQKNRSFLNKRLRLTRLIFILSLFLPVIVFLIFYSGTLESKKTFTKAEADNIFKPVARVETPSGMGTAFLVGETTLLTARHVVDDLEIGDHVSLFFDKAPELPVCEAEIRWYDPVTPGEDSYLLTDIAVLRLVDDHIIPSDFPRLKLGESYLMEVTDEVMIIGYPQGDFAATEGTISNNEVHGLDMFKLDVESYQGHSGGPLVSQEDQNTIGILIAGMTGDFQGINFALKIDNVLEMLYNEGISLNE